MKDIDQPFPEHSILGASSAERWMNCPGSIALLKYLGYPQTDEAEYIKEGIAAHEAAAYALKENLEGWEITGQTFYGIEIDLAQATAIQTYLSYIALLPEGSSWIEASVGATRSGTVHNQFYGTVDHARVAGDTLFITDYKNGEGIIVEVKNNAQLMYYALAFLLTMPGMENVQNITLAIVQPRAFHPDGPIRTWTVDADYVRKWGDEVLFPAMQATEIDNTLTPGPWCRFCPAKLVCPMLTGMFGAMAKSDMRTYSNMSDERLGLEYQQIAAVKFHIQALEQEALKRRMEGHLVPGTKLVNKRASRVWKSGAKEVFYSKFGVDTMTEPEFKTPAEMSKLGAQARKLVAEYAYTPDTGYTLTSPDDPRIEVRVQRPSEVWTVDKLTGEPQVTKADATSVVASTKGISNDE